MSGPKCYKCKVVSEAELLRRESEALERRCEALVGKCQKALAELDNPDFLSIPKAKSNDRAELIKWEDELRSTISKIQLQSDRDYAKRIVGKMKGCAAPLDTSAIRMHTHAPQANQQDDQTRISFEEIDKLLSIIATVRNRRNAASLVERIISLSKSDDIAQARGDLLTVKTELSQLLYIQNLRELAANELLRIEGITNSAAARARDVAIEISTQAEYEELKRLIKKAEIEHAKKQDEDYISKALQDALAELGYSPLESFDVTDFGNVVLAEHPNYSDYALRTQINPNNGMMFTRIVAFEEHGLEEDTEVEKASCSQIHAMREKMSDQGIELTLTSERAAGTRPVELIEKERKKRSDGRKKQQETGIIRER
ncbi:MULTISPECIES: hypothetical protein [unclassified Adlercreutzia]|uniref:hypothetical protein n=1 Tax=unclassified Adlercreutzia TaxID=2636013 RepID=UPI0013EC75D9|nr:MULTISPECIES: hypothetical protein [unclassified Adlercreutzia]